MKKFYIIALALIVFISNRIYAQVGIGTTTPTGALDVTSTSNGLVIPRVTLSSAIVSAPVVNPQGGALTTSTLVYNTATAGTSPNNVTPGFYFWNGTRWTAVGSTSNSWLTTGNSALNGGNTTTAGTNFIGTTDAQNLDFRTNNNFVGRFSSLGEFFVGTLNTVLAGDLMNGVANTSFPWALNGYSSFNGAAVYGLRQAGATGTWGSIQGETTSSIGANNSGVSGLAMSTTHRGVVGQKPSGGAGWGGLFLNDLGYTGGLYNASDRRLKKNIKRFNEALPIINSISLYTYNFRTDEYDNLGDETIHFGVMADELKVAVPSLVRTKSIAPAAVRSISADKQFKSPQFDIDMVNYTELIPIAIQGIKEQQETIVAQEKRIQDLEIMVRKLQAMVEAKK